MSVSRVVLGAVVVGMVAVTGCRVSVETKSRYVEEPVTPVGQPAGGFPWAGEKIKIQIEGVGVSINGGVRVTADPQATTISATARMLAMAFEKPDADASIIDAKATFTVTNAGGQILLACGHGQNHGSSSSGESGCELATVTIPGGSATQPLDLTVLAGNGELNLQLSGATIINVGANNNGSGDTIAALPGTTGGSIGIVSSKAGDITASLPPNFAADEIILQADADKITNNFPDAQLSAGRGSRGTVGSGLRSIKLTSTEFAGSTGKIALQ
jgi:hypothetical protein